MPRILDKYSVETLITFILILHIYTKGTQNVKNYIKLGQKPSKSI
jgi:hypothetical protein